MIGLGGLSLSWAKGSPIELCPQWSIILTQNQFSYVGSKSVIWYLFNCWSSKDAIILLIPSLDWLWRSSYLLKSSSLDISQLTIIFFRLYFTDETLTATGKSSTWLAMPLPNVLWSKIFLVEIQNQFSRVGSNSVRICLFTFISSYIASIFFGPSSE